MILFSGRGGFKAAMKAVEKHYNAKTFDLEDHKDEDFVTIVGVLYATWCVLSCAAGGTLWLCPDCKTWLSYMSRNTFKRGPSGAHTLGNDAHESVREANNTAVYSSWLIAVATFRAVYMAIEQPLNSLMYHHSPLLSTLLMVHARRLTPSLGAYGAASVKQLEIYSTLPEDLVGKYLSRGKRECTRRFAAEGVHVERLATRNGKWTTGVRKSMKASREYPAEFGNAIVAIMAEAWQQYHNGNSDPQYYSLGAHT